VGIDEVIGNSNILRTKFGFNSTQYIINIFAKQKCFSGEPILLKKVKPLVK